MRHRLVACLLVLVACRNQHHTDASVTLDAHRDVVRDVADAETEDVVVDAPPAPRRVVVTLTGDIMLHRTVLETFEHHGNQGGLAWTLNWISPLITAREVALTWLDSPLTDAYRPPFTGVPPVLGTPRGQARTIARDLARVGLDGVCLATQHAYDQMGAGLGETVDALRAAGLGTAGVGADGAAWAPWITERDGVRVAHVCFTQRVMMGPGRNDAHVAVAQAADDAQALAAVATARPQADVVVVGIQWNRAPFRPLSTEQRALALRLIEAGADVVVGSGTASPGIVERVTSPRGDAVFVTSIGSLLSGYGGLWRGVRNPPPANVDRILWDASVRDVALLRAQFEVSDGGHLGLVTLTANALWTTHGPEGVRVVPLRYLTDFEVREARARAMTATLGPEVRVRQ